MNNCDWLHKKIEELPLIKYPFNLEDLPKNGIYFFYEKDETSKHEGVPGRIVRVGTHKGNNFRSRMNDHFLFNERKMNFNSMSSAPKDRSIFRKNIGRAVLNKKKDKYIEIWNIDFTSRGNRENYGNLRDIEKEKEIETMITKTLRNNFSFRFLVIDSQTDRMGTQGLESTLIGTIARCKLCVPSSSWWGNHSPIKKIETNGLWLVQHLNADAINENSRIAIFNAMGETKKWIGGR